MSTTEQEVPTIESRSALEDAIAQIADLEADLTQKENEKSQEERKLNRRFKPQLKRRQEKLDRVKSAALEYCRAHKGELLEDVDGKTAKLLTGDVQYKKGRAKIIYTGDKADIIARLLEAGLDDLVVRKPKIYKKTLMKNWKEIQAKGIEGLERKDGQERITIKPMAA